MSLIERKEIYEFIQSGLLESKLFSNEIKDDQKENYLKLIKRLIYSDCSEDSQNVKNFLDWAKGKSNLRVVQTDVPESILASNNQATLYDIKVHSRGPDDFVYDKNSEMRAKVPRGNCVIKYKNNDYDLLVYALRKFTGGMGDEDEIDRNRNDYRKYFLKDIEQTERVVSLEKANGEAAHFSCRFLDGHFLLCAGSKNVHLVFRESNQIDSYAEDRFFYAKKIAHAIDDHFNKNMNSKTRGLFLSFLAYTKMTVIFEILMPDSQHVVDLSYLNEPLLKFITFCENKIYDKPASLCYLPPELSIEIGKLFEFSCVNYTLFPFSEVEQHLIDIRNGHNSEGQVIYFIDSSSNVIGLLKKKTTWYIIIRAIREKLRGYISPKSTKTIDTLEKAASGRLKSIQAWIGFSDDVLEKWTQLSVKFFKWFDHMYKTNKVTREEFGTRYPEIWSRFLNENNLSDKIDMKLEHEFDLKKENNSKTEASNSNSNQNDDSDDDEIQG